jgi:hypothetical protein
MFRFMLRPALVLTVTLVSVALFTVWAARQIPQTALEAIGFTHRACHFPCWYELEVGRATAADVQTVLFDAPFNLSRADFELAPQVFAFDTSHGYLSLSFDPQKVLVHASLTNAMCMTDILASLGLPDDAIRHRNGSVIYSYWYGDDSIWIFYSSSRNVNDITELQIYTFTHFRERERYNLGAYTPYYIAANQFRQGC